MYNQSVRSVWTRPLDDSTQLGESHMTLPGEKKSDFGEELTSATGSLSNGHFQIEDFTPNIMTFAKVSCSVVYSWIASAVCVPKGSN